MRPSESPFPCAWWGTALENVGLGGVRPYWGTYGRYAFDDLPPVPVRLKGDLAWLEAAPVREEHVGRWMEEHDPGKNRKAAASVRKAAKQKGLPLPPAFARFIADPALRERLRSSTDCFYDLGRAPVRSPAGDGYLVRFLCDSQGCLMWYLYLTADGSDHAVVASPDFHGTPAERRAAHAWVRDDPDPNEITFCGPSFEEFLCRFWLENELAFADDADGPLPPAAAEYLRRYRKVQEASGRPYVRDWKTRARFFPWSHVQRWVNRISREKYPAWLAASLKQYARQARPCPKCGRTPRRLFWLALMSPEADWEAGTGRLGRLALCPRCRAQVEFLVDPEGTELVAQAWREHHELP